VTTTATTTPFLNEASQRDLVAVCSRHGIKWLAVFGSVARGEARPDSDVDVLVTFKPGFPVGGYIGLERAAEELSPLFGGRWVDIGQPKQLHWFIRDRVLAEARVLYEG
jgi:predicted nucleotidyltransferase